MKRDAFLKFAHRNGIAPELRPIDPEGRVYRFETVGYKCLLILFTEGEEVTSVQFYCGFTEGAELERLNHWNRERRFVRAYLRDNGQGLSVELDFAASGLSDSALRDYAGIWASQLVSLSEFNWDA